MQNDDIELLQLLRNTEPTQQSSRVGEISNLMTCIVQHRLEGRSQRIPREASRRRVQPRLLLLPSVDGGYDRSEIIASPFGVAYGCLPVITPPRMRAVVTAGFMLVVNLGMLLGPPLAGFCNERLFPQADGVRWSLLTVTPVFCHGT